MNRKWLISALLLLLTFPYYLYLQRAHPLIGEEFMLFVQAERVLNGEVPYRDFFQFITPGSIYLAALLFKIFGIKLTVMKIFIAFTGSVLVIFTYLISTEIINKPLLAVMPAILVTFFSIPQAPLFYHHWNAEVLILLAILLGLKYVSTHNPFYIFLCGLVSGIVFLFLQHKGIFIFTAIVLFLIVDYFINRERQLKPIILVTAGFFITLAPFFLFLYHTGAINKFFYDCFVWVRESYAPFNSLPEYLYFEKKTFQYYFQKTHLFPAIIRTRNELFAGYLPIFIFLYCAIDLFKNFKNHMFFIFLASLFLFLSVLQRPDFINILYVSQPLFVLLIYYLNGIFAEKNNKLKIFAGKFIVVLLILNVLYGFISAARDATLYRYSVKTPRGIIYFKSIDEANHFSNIFALLDSSIKNKRIFIYNWSTFFYFLSGIRNYTPYDVILPGYNTEKQLDDLIGRLSNNKIEYIIYDSMDLLIKKYGEDSMYPVGYKRIDLKNKLNEYINTNYDVIDEIGGIKIMKLR